MADEEYPVDDTEDGHRFCPDCGKRTLRLIEATLTADGSTHICTCDDCENMVHLFVGGKRVDPVERDHSDRQHEI